MNFNNNFKSCPLKKRPIVYLIEDPEDDDEPQDLRIKRSKFYDFYEDNISVTQPLDLSITNNSIEEDNNYCIQLNQSRIFNNNDTLSRSVSPLSSISNDSLVSINSISSSSPKIIQYSRFNRDSSSDSLNHQHHQQRNYGICMKRTYEWIPNVIDDTQLRLQHQYHHQEEEVEEQTKYTTKCSPPNHDAVIIRCSRDSNNQRHRQSSSSSAPKPEDLTINGNIPIPALQHGIKNHNFELKKVSQIKNNVVKQHNCSKCSKSYSTLAGLSKHIEFHCMKIDGNKATKYFSCLDCNKNYHSAGALKMHIRTHTLPCKCEICGKSFSRPWLLQGHIRTHTGEKPYSCEQCLRAFSDRSNLRAHQQTHEKIKKFVCTECWRTFSRKSLLRKHELDHSQCFLSKDFF